MSFASVVRANRRRAMLSIGLFLALVGVANASLHVTETGSTELYPILTVWIQHYLQSDSGVKIDASSTGSGAGIVAAMKGRAQIGGSDAFANDAQTKSGLLSIPLAVAAQEIVYNVKELRGGPPLNFSGPVLAGMYGGTIAMWDDPKIAAINPGRTLPHMPIVAIHRNDGSGDTAMFTEYLSLTTPSWMKTVHFGTDVRWPKNRKSQQATGNAQMIETAQNTKNSIAYIGIAYADRARSAGLDVAALRNRSGAFVLPTVDATRATAEAAAGRVPPDGRLSLIDTPGPAAYPLVNFEYAVVKTTQTKTGMAGAMRAFLTWIVTPDQGNDPDLLAQVHFAPLPERVRTIALSQIGTIAGP
jgi:phosphate transport system substrate-binding protein